MNIRDLPVISRVPGFVLLGVGLVSGVTFLKWAAKKEVEASKQSPVYPGKLGKIKRGGE